MPHKMMYRILCSTQGGVVCTSTRTVCRQGRYCAFVHFLLIKIFIFISKTAISWESKQRTEFINLYVKQKSKRNTGNEWFSTATNLYISKVFGKSNQTNFSNIRKNLRIWRQLQRCMGNLSPQHHFYSILFYSILFYSLSTTNSIQTLNYAD